MPMPFDSKLTKLRILMRRAEKRHKAAIEALEKAEYEARREREILGQELMARLRELGYCPYCELPEGECEGHTLIALGA